MDTHAHFLPSHFEKFSLNFNHTLQNFNSKIVIIATNPTEWSVALELANQNKQLYFTVGIHPYFVIKNIAELDQNCILLRQFIEENIKNTKLVAIGESGISVEEHQITEFKAQKRSLLVHCELSKKYGKCLITHCHKESQQRSVLQIVKQFKIKGISHGFGGTMEQAQQLNDMGWKGSMNSFSSAKKIASIIKHVGYKFILLETDSPYGAVIGGPEQVVEIATRLSQALDISLSELVEKCNQNAKDIYKYQ
ncbi:Hydrolase, TatD family [Spironucleus salmonicida]|nr:Hydrolase, TatD family [Spironucleus salmonicida]